MRLKFFILILGSLFFIPLFAKDSSKIKHSKVKITTSSKIERGNKAKDWAKNLKMLRKRQRIKEIKKELKKIRRQKHRNIRKDCTGKHRRLRKHDGSGRR